MADWAQREYGKAFENWPKNEQGEPVSPAWLTSCSPLDMQSEMVQSMLECYGIPSLRMAPGDGAFGELILGMSGTGLDIYVPETMLEDAKALMEADNDEEYSVED